MMTMPNRRQFIHHSSAALLACGLIASLARGETVPYEPTASAPSFGHNSRMSGSPGEMVNLADDPDYRDVLIKHRACLKEHARQYEDETALRMLESSIF